MDWRFIRRGRMSEFLVIYWGFDGADEDRIARTIMILLEKKGKREWKSEKNALVRIPVDLVWQVNEMSRQPIPTRSVLIRRPRIIGKALQQESDILPAPKSTTRPAAPKRRRRSSNPAGRLPDMRVRLITV